MLLSQMEGIMKTPIYTVRVVLEKGYRQEDGTILAVETEKETEHSTYDYILAKGWYLSSIDGGYE